MKAAALDVRTVQPLIRPDPTAAVRPADQTKERFQVGVDDAADDKAKAASRDQAEAFQIDADDRSKYVAGAARGRGRGQGAGLLGAFTNFLTKIFTQADDPSATAGIRLAGNGAYQRANAVNADASALAAGNVAVQTAGFPQLSSGRVVDLSI